MRLFCFSILVSCTPDAAVTPTLDPATPIPTPVPTETVERVGWLAHPLHPLVSAGETLQLRGRALWSDGTTTQIGAEITWSSADAEAAVDASGLLTGATTGNPRILAALDGVQVQLQGRVHAPSATITSLALEPAASRILVGDPLLLSARATLSDGSWGDPSPACAWDSSDPAVAAVGAAGSVLAVSSGTATLRATCGGVEASMALTVEPEGAVIPPPALRIAALEVVPVEPGRVRLLVDVQNDGGQSPPVQLDLFMHAVDPSGEAQRVAMLPGVGPATTTRVELEGLLPPDAPDTITAWARIDPLERLPDPDRADNTASAEMIQPVLPVSDIAVSFDQAIVFGPTDAAVVISVTNLGPDPATDLVVHFERDQPGVSSLSDLDPATAERSQAIPTLSVGQTYTWLMDYDQIPYPDPWWSCGFVRADGFDDPSLANNFDCLLFQEF